MEAKCTIRHEVYMVGVIEAIMGVIVTSAGRDRRDHIEVVQLGNLMEFTMLEEKVHHLSDIGAVKVVMVLHITSIPLTYFIQEADQLVVVYEIGLICSKGQIFHTTENYGLECILTTDLPAYIKHIEVKCVYGVQYLLPVI